MRASTTRPAHSRTSGANGPRVASMAASWLRGTANDLVTTARLCRDLPRFLRSPLPVEAAGERIRQRLASRPTRFLEMVARYVYGYPPSPYLRLLRMAGCEFGDLRALVEREGVEGALGKLAAAGVYVTFDELKGRQPIVRGSTSFTVRERDFDTPGVRAHFEAYTGGSGGAPSVIRTNLRYIADLAWDTAAALQAHGVGQVDHVVWLTAGVKVMLTYSALGRPPLAWVYSTRPLPFKIWAGAWLLGALGQLAGFPLPRPRYADLQAPAGLARWLAEHQRPLCVTAYASSAVRVCLAAAELGLPLNHVTFVTLGEPFTTAKETIVRRTGARTLVRYAFNEGGIVGYACVNPSSPDDLHLMSHAHPVIRHRRQLNRTGETVEALLVTSLRERPPKVLINAETGDTAELETRACDCPLGALGLTTHLATIRSFEKLSSEGMTFARANLLRVLEEALPARIGGTAADYQVIERDGADGLSRLELVVDPRLGPLDEERIRAVFLEEMARDGAAEQLGTALWERAGTVVVRRARPVPTTAGKVLPFLVVKT